MSNERIPVDRLCPGLYIRLELTWLDHPFMLNRFKLKSEEQIQALRKAGVSHVVLVRERSDPAALATLETQPEPPPPAPSPVDDGLWAAKRERVERVRELRQRLQQTEKKFEHSLDTIKTLMRDLNAQPRAALDEAERLAGDLAALFLDDPSVVLNLVNVKPHEENLYYHALNVTVLSMTLGAAYGLDQDALRLLGQGALFHDIGKLRLPSQLLRKTTPLSRAEQALYELHPHYGRELMEKLAVLPPRVLVIIDQHHETMDGRGFPQRLPPKAIDPLARMVAIANGYDNLCNPRVQADALSPAEAVSHMYARQRTRYDETLLALFIRSLGVYPPGSIVRLNDDHIGLVVAMEPQAMLRPTVLLYDPETPRKEALMIDLREEPALEITETLPPGQLDPEIYAYLSPQTRISYFVSPQREP